MPKNSIQLPLPTPELVARFIQEFDNEQVVVELALTKLIKTFPNNNALDEILLKEVAINDLYRTRIFATYQVAENIFKQNVGNAIQSGELEAVSSIANVRLKKDKNWNFYSFATKYCAWHNPDHYVIYDSYVGQILWDYKNQFKFYNFKRNELWEYGRFKEIVVCFRECYGLGAFSLKEIDKFLWSAGKKYYLPSEQPPQDQVPNQQ